MAMQSQITPKRIEAFKNSRFNPIRYLTPETLSDSLQQFDYGTLEWPAQVLTEIKERDAIISAVSAKRRMKAESFIWEIAKIPESENEDFEAHRDALKYAYNNIVATDALDRDKQRSIQGLFGDMNEAQGMKWQVHELIARPSMSGLTFEIVACPLCFFENRTGKLRFLPSQGYYTGEDMDPRRWMVTRGLFLMKPSAIAYMFARIPQEDWLFYNEAHACPGILGKTTAQQGTDQHDALLTLVAAAGTANFKGVINDKDSVDAIQFGATGPLPFQPLIEHQQRLITTIWMGGDLSTLSSNKPGQVGSTNQSEDQKCIEDHDAQVITETLNMKLDKLILEYYFGPDVKPAAYIRVRPRREPDIAAIIQKRQFLIDNGAQVGIDATREELGVPKPAEDEPLFEKRQAQPVGNQGQSIPIDFGEDAGNTARNDTQKTADAAMGELQRKTLSMLADAKADAYKPLADRLLGILELPTQEAQQVALSNLEKDWPRILHEMNEASGNAISVLEGAQWAALFNGLSQTAVATHPRRNGVAKNSKRETSYVFERNADGEISGLKAVEKIARGK